MQSFRIPFHGACPPTAVLSPVFLLFLVLSCSFTTVHGDSPIGDDEARPRLPWQDAGAVIGKLAFIHGTIISVGHTQRVHFLDFSKDDRSAFTVVVFAEALSDFPQSLEQMYADKLIEVRGVVSLYAGSPQIVVSSPSQIRVLEQPPQRFLPPQFDVEVGSEITIASYNVENLFDGHDDPYRHDESTPAKPRQDIERFAAVLREVNADVLALQEVETRGYLQRFLDVVVPDLGYQHVVHFEGNDTRGIDVCLVSRVPVGKVTSLRHLQFPGPDGKDYSFQRDLLQVELVPSGGTPWEMWIVHLKSNSGGRDAAEPIRQAEARCLREQLDRRLQQDPNAAVIVCGDFNDSWESASLQTIVGSGDRMLQTGCFELPIDQRISY
ncbi:MAG: endonuclease/exonuclease/phosphatase family protein, partial [Planctomycetales bacterium]|nr:endonuclease/exonuclease/phosphatase family protein [Planctomycetales bacterium]